MLLHCNDILHIYIKTKIKFHHTQILVWDYHIIVPGKTSALDSPLDSLQLPASGSFYVFFTSFLKYPSAYLYLSKHHLQLSSETIPAYDDFTPQWHLTTPSIWLLIMCLLVTLPICFNWIVLTVHIYCQGPDPRFNLILNSRKMGCWRTNQLVKTIENSPSLPCHFLQTPHIPSYPFGCLI